MLGYLGLLLGAVENIPALAREAGDTAPSFLNLPSWETCHISSLKQWASPHFTTLPSDGLSLAFVSSRAGLRPCKALPPSCRLHSPPPRICPRVQFRRRDALNPTCPRRSAGSPLPRCPCCLPSQSSPAAQPRAYDLSPAWRLPRAEQEALMKQLRDAKAAFQAEDTLSSLFSTPFACLCNSHCFLPPSTLPSSPSPGDQKK